MRTIDYIHDVVLPGAYQLLPPRMASRQADALPPRLERLGDCK